MLLICTKHSSSPATLVIIARHVAILVARTHHNHTPTPTVRLSMAPSVLSTRTGGGALAARDIIHVDDLHLCLVVMVLRCSTSCTLHDTIVWYRLVLPTAFGVLDGQDVGGAW
jgi:hypothetical protein